MAGSGASGKTLGLPEPEQPRSRSPHPYTFSSSTLPAGNDADFVLDEKAKTSAAGDETSIAVLPEYFDADHRKRRKQLDESSESATEADDEKEPLLLRLPAPNVRPRKGFKGDVGSGSPLLTPSYLDDERRTGLLENKARRRASIHSQDTEAEAIKIREKYKRRRRAEVIRRVTETTLFLVVASIGTKGGFDSSTVFFWNRYGTQKLLYGQPMPPLLSFCSIVLALYLLYPARIVFHNCGLSVRNKKPWYYIHLPAAFDPAPLIYPVFLPASVACLVSGSDSITLLCNLVLGISSMPSKVIPFGTMGWCSSPAWILSIMPMLSFQQLADQKGPVTTSHRDLDIMTFLHPFHQVVLPILRNLTTTSLLPAELQLLSVALINLCILSETPQAQILRAVLWIGSVGLLVFNSKLLRVGVSIARIPTWRLKRSRIPRRSSWTLVQALYDLSDALHSREHPNDVSDEDAPIIQRRTSGANRRLGRAYNLSVDVGNQVPVLQKAPTISAISDDFQVKPTMATPNGSTRDHPIKRRGRSNTLPVNTSATEDIMSISRPGMTVTHASRMLQKASLRNMTPSQATVLRWLMAAYFYVMVLGLILIPIKGYVQSQALRGSEPIAWAFDYLFGDLQGFHYLVDNWNLRQWIPDQDHQQIKFDLNPTSLAEKLRVRIGLANTRLLICGYAIMVIVGGLAVVFRLSPVADVDTRRKVFHGMMVLMFLPTSFIDPAFVGLAFALVLVIFLVLDLIRASQLPPLARPLTNFLAPYVDGRDHRGPVIVSHIFLLIGCAIPLWLSLASLPRMKTSLWDGWELPTKDLSMVSGIICVGMGDAAASLFGRRYGRRRWCWSGGKSLEGSLAFAMAVVIGLTLARIWLLVGAWPGDSGDSFALFWSKALIAGCGASLTEAVLTGGNDNVIVPVVLWILVKGLGV